MEGRPIARAAEETRRLWPEASVIDCAAAMMARRTLAACGAGRYSVASAKRRRADLQPAGVTVVIIRPDLRKSA